jgi:hypothetical protein
MNIELSQNNHLKWGYNGIPGSIRQSPYDKFFIQYGKIQRELDFRNACIETANEISKKAENDQKKPLIFFSGGIDSEAIIYSFLLAKKDFSVIHIRYGPNFNNHEFDYVKTIVATYDIDIKIFEIDTLKYLDNPENFDLALRDNSIFLELNLLCSVTKDIRDKFFPVLDHPGTYLYREDTSVNLPGRWYYKDYEHLMFYYNHCVNESMSGCPSFYHWSPEILYGFLTDPLIKNLTDGVFPGKITNRTSTLKLYQNTFPEFNFMSRSKYTGHEFIDKEILNKFHFRLYSKLKYNRHSAQRYEYSEIVNLLRNT